MRDLCRCREAAGEDLTRARHRLSKMLMRRGFLYRVGRNWTQRHRQWLRSLEFEDLATRTVFEDYLTVVELGEQRVRALKARLEEIAQRSPIRSGSVCYAVSAASIRSRR